MPRLFDRVTRSLERTLKTDIRYLASGGFWALVGQGAVSFASLALAFVVAHYVSQEVYGEYRYIIAVVGTLSIFSLSNLNMAVLQSTASGFDSALPEAFRTNLRWSAGIFLGALAVGLYYIVAGNLTLGIGVFIGGSLAPFITSSAFYGPFLSGKKDFKRGALYADFIAATATPALLILTALVAPTPLALTAVYFGSGALISYLLYRKTLSVYRPDLAKRDPGMLGYAKHLSLMGVVTGIAGTIDQLLAFHFVGAAGLAVYNFATGVVDQTKGPLKSLDAMMQARFAKRSAASVAEGMGNKLWLLLLACIAFIGVYLLAAPWIYRLLFPLYVNAVPYSQLYAISILSVVFWPASSYLAAQRKIREQYIGNIAVAVFQIAALALGTIYWGLWGLITARVLIRLFGGAFFYLVYRRSPAGML